MSKVINSIEYNVKANDFVRKFISTDIKFFEHEDI